MEEVSKPENNMATAKYRGGSIIFSFRFFTAGKTGALNKTDFLMPKKYDVEMLKQHEDVRRLGKNSSVLQMSPSILPN